MTWKDSYAIGNAQIDQQHKMLVETLSKLLLCLQDCTGSNRDACKSTIDFLNSYGASHFAAEELLMESVGFSETARHKALHADYKEEVHQLELMLMRNDYDRDSAGKLAEFLTKWWIFHIVKEDKKLAAYCK